MIGNKVGVMSYKVVFHIDWDDDQTLRMGLANMINLLNDGDSSGSEIHMVANGHAVRLFRKEFAEGNMHQIEELNSKGVRFCLCNNSMNKFNYKKQDMLDACEIVPAGVAELCKLQASGCAYIKP
ncbi:DsrE family protein [Maridesulfovibrio sp. FT414]|uniref:DsrE family protein n=1 Tax=Maridesulfovibrio sp. FT414 TaxID=2979469 RepID=UPI003D8016DB